MGGSKSQTTGYQYFLGMHLVTCLGPVDSLIEIQVDSKTAFLGPQSAGQFVVNKPQLFGGKTREGGVAGYCSFLTGHKTQEPNSYLQAKLGSDIPNFRGVVSFILEQMYLGMNPYLKLWAFKLQRIHVRQDGLAQWYDDKAAIGYFVGDESDVEIVTQYKGQSDVAIGNGWFDTPIAACNEIAAAYAVVYPPPTWTDWHAINVTEAGGTLAYNYYGVPREDGGEITLVTREIENNENPTSYHYDMNPAHIIRECLTDPDWGMGYNEADIDDANFTAAADALYDEKFGLSFLWDRQTEIGDFIETVLRHIDAACYVDRTTGLYVLKLIRDDYDVDDLIHLTENDIDKVDDFKRSQFGELTTSVTVKFWDGATNTDASVTLQDIALEQTQNAQINTTLQYPGINNKALATRVAKRDLTTLSSQLASCTIYTNRKAKSLQVGSVFLMTWPDCDLEATPMRVSKIAYGDGRNNRIRLSCSEDVFSLDDKALLPTIPPAWENPNGPPVVITIRKPFEVPYLEIVQQQGQADTDTQLASAPETGYVGIAAKRPQSGALNATMYTNAGAGFGNVGILDFCPTATLTGALDKISTTFPIANADRLIDVTIGSWGQIEEEIFAVVSIAETLDSIEVERGCLDTVPAEHPTDAVLFFWDNASAADQTPYVESEEIQIKLTTNTGSAALELADAAIDTVTIVGRAARPYPPGNFKLNGDYFPATIDAEPVLTWAHRDRLQQTSINLVGFPEGNIGPEAGTTYTVTIKDPDDVVIRTESGILGTTYTYEAADEIADGGPYETLTFELRSFRDGLESYQFQSVTVSRPVPIVPEGFFTPIVGADVPLTLLWNNGRFVVAVKGTVGSADAIGLYGITDDFSSDPEFIGMSYDGRNGSSGNYVPSAYESLNRRVVAGGVDEVFMAFWGITIFGDMTANDRWLMIEDDVIPKFEIINTAASLNTHVIATVRKANGDFIAIGAADTSISPTLPAKVYKSTTNGHTWISQGNSVGLGAYAYVDAQPMYELADGSLWISKGFYGAKNDDGEGVNWSQIFVPTGGLGDYSSARVVGSAYDGTALLVVFEIVLAFQFPIVVASDTPVMWLRFGDNRAANVVLIEEISGASARFSPGVGIIGAGISQVTGLFGGSTKALRTFEATYMEPRTSGNGPVNYIQGTTNFTVEFWQKLSPSNSIPTLTITLFTQTKLLTGGGWYYQIELTYLPSTQVYTFKVRGLSGNLAVAGAVELNISGAGPDLFDGDVHHVAISRGAGGQAAITVDGSVVASQGSGTVSDLTAGSLAAGTVFGNDFNANLIHYECLLDECAIYTRELSLVELQEHYEAAFDDGLKRNVIYRSLDNGDTFVKERDVLLDDDIDAGVVDDGIEWRTVIAHEDGFYVYGVVPSVDAFPYVLKSIDHGDTWNKYAVVTDGIPDDSIIMNAVAHGSNVVAVMKSTKTISGDLYPMFGKSSDGINFVPLSVTFPPSGDDVSSGSRSSETDDSLITETGDVRVLE